MICRQLRRSQVLLHFQNPPSYLVGIEACATAHYWARDSSALGHQVRLMPPNYVKPYVKRHTNYMADAEAICKAVERPNMRFIAVKNAVQQSVLMLHRSREVLVRQRTILVNTIRAHMAEFDIVVLASLHNVRKLLSIREAPAKTGCRRLQRCTMWHWLNSSWPLVRNLLPMRSASMLGIERMRLAGTLRQFQGADRPLRRCWRRP